MGDERKTLGICTICGEPVKALGPAVAEPKIGFDAEPGDPVEFEFTHVGCEHKTWGRFLDMAEAVLTADRPKEGEDDE